MSLLPFIVVTLGAAVGALLTRRWPRSSLAIGLAGLGLATLAALAIVPGDHAVVGTGQVQATEFGRLFLTLGAFTGLIIAVVALATEWRPDLPAALLGGFGTLAVALAVGDPTDRPPGGPRRLPRGDPDHGRVAGHRPGRDRRQPRVPGDRGRRRPRDRGHGLDRPADRDPAGRSHASTGSPSSRSRSGRRSGSGRSRSTAGRLASPTPRRSRPSRSCSPGHQPGSRWSPSPGWTGRWLPCSCRSTSSAGWSWPSPP